MEAAAPGTSDQGTMAFLWAALAGAAVSLVLGVYAREHHPAGQALFTLGFSGTINMKAWLATLALTLAVVQIVLALWMYGKLGDRGAPSWVGPTHRLVGTCALLVSLPVVYHCLWSLGFETRRRIDRAASSTPSSAACSTAPSRPRSCACARARMPGWALPVVGGLLFACLVGLWLTSALWFFTNVGFPSF